MLPAFLAAALLALLGAYFATRNFTPDLFIYRAGAALGLRGVSPYDAGRIAGAVAGQYPDDPDLVANCGFFLPPLAVLLFAPFAAVPWPAAKLLYAALCGAAGYAAARAPLLFRSDAAPLPGSRALWLGFPFLLLLNFLTTAVVRVGQTTLLAVGCVAAGQWCFERRRPVLGCLLWAVPFVKPHLALPLLPLAWYLGGWKRAAGVLAAVVGLNVVGATVAGGSPLFLRDYAEFVRGAHKGVAYNRVELNREITSWNRLVYQFTKPYAGGRLLVEQTAPVTVASYAVWFALLAARCAAAGTRPAASWAAAAAAVGAVFCAQVLAYELLVLVLVVPWVRDLFAAGWRERGLVAVLLLAVQTIPYEAVSRAGIEWHRPVGVALLAALLLAGPVTVGSRPTVDRSVG